MRLKELKQMIIEEYTKFMAEQGAMPPTAGAPVMPGEPMIDVEPGDIDAMGGDNAEAELRKIYDMLKAYFEGGEGAGMDMDDAGADMGADMGDDMEDLTTADAGADSAKDDADDKKDDKEDDKDDKEDDKEDEDKALQERFQKLANIIKG
jgi:hypothetical protein